MAYLLDTNAAIALMKEHPHVVRHVRRVGRSELRLCAPVEAELWYGVYKSGKPEENRKRLLTFVSVAQPAFRRRCHPAFRRNPRISRPQGNAHRPL